MTSNEATPRPTGANQPGPYVSFAPWPSFRDDEIEAVSAVNPYAVDVSTGVEIYHGKKDHALMDLFIRTVRSLNGGSGRHE